jgi:hypothetical protein
MSPTICLATNGTLRWPKAAGHFWVFLNWALGLSALGCRVVWLERITADLHAEEVPKLILNLRTCLEAYGLENCLALFWETEPPAPSDVFNGCLTFEEARGADLLLNLAYDIPFVGLFRRSAFVGFGVGLAYTALYCAHCAANAKLDVLIETEPNPSWSKLLKWRTLIAYLNFLEPVARDWGRLKGGLVPWRGVRSAEKRVHSISKWWHRMYPFGWEVRWSIPGAMALEKFAFLQELTRKLNEAGCAVGWNPTTENWDLGTRRGALVEAHLRMVTEHHGGPKRLARVSAALRPPKSTSLVLVGLAVFTVIFGVAKLLWPAAAVLLALGVMWLLLVTQGARLERGIIAACAAVGRDLHENDSQALSATGKENRSGGWGNDLMEFRADRPTRRCLLLPSTTVPEINWFESVLLVAADEVAADLMGKEENAHA